MYEDFRFIAPGVSALRVEANVWVLGRRAHKIRPVQSGCVPHFSPIWLPQKHVDGAPVPLRQLASKEPMCTQSDVPLVSGAQSSVELCAVDARTEECSTHGSLLGLNFVSVSVVAVARVTAASVVS